MAKKSQSQSTTNVPPNLDALVKKIVSDFQDNQQFTKASTKENNVKTPQKKRTRSSNNTKILLNRKKKAEKKD